MDVLLGSHSLVGLSHFLEDASVLLGNDGTDDQQSGNHQDAGNDQADDHVLDQTGQNEADEGHARRLFFCRCRGQNDISTKCSLGTYVQTA